MCLGNAAWLFLLEVPLKRFPAFLPLAPARGSLEVASARLQGSLPGGVLPPWAFPARGLPGVTLPAVRNSLLPRLLEAGAALRRNPYSAENMQWFLMEAGRYRAELYKR